MGGIWGSVVDRGKELGSVVDCGKVRRSVVDRGKVRWSVVDREKAMEVCDRPRGWSRSSRQWGCCGGR